MISARPNPAALAAARRRSTATRDFVDHHLADCVSVGDEVRVLLDLSREITAQDLTDAIGQRVIEALDAAAFEAELRYGPDMAGLRLRRLAALRVRVNASAIALNYRAAACASLRRIDQLIHADAATAEGEAATEVKPAPGSATGWR